jgi:hypothetical protein
MEWLDLLSTKEISDIPEAMLYERHSGVVVTSTRSEIEMVILYHQLNVLADQPVPENHKKLLVMFNLIQ